LAAQSQPAADEQCLYQGAELQKRAVTV